MSVESSKEGFLQALERLLSRTDSSELGVNSVAREAGLNKALVYRYFGSWNGLLEDFARRVNPWRDLREEADQGFERGRWPTVRDFLKWLFGTYLEKLHQSSLLQNLLIRSLVTRDPLQSALERDRESEGLALLSSAAKAFPGAPFPDPAAITALLVGGLSWLIVSGLRVGVFSGLVFQGPGADALPRLHDAIGVWVDRLTDSPPVHRL